MIDERYHQCNFKYKYISRVNQEIMTKDDCSNTSGSKMLAKTQKNEECNLKIVNALYVDCYKDATLTTIKTSNSKFYPKIKIEELYVIVSEPRKQYKPT